MKGGAIPLDPQMQAALPVLLRLEEAGFQAVFVGGCVRDLLLGLPLHDVDIASSATPEEAMELFPDAIPTGLRHGTVTVRHGGRLYELTTFRTDGEYGDARRPDEVRFVRSLEEDLRRRDFTINAMAMDRSGRLTDPFGGQADLRNRTLRAVGAAEERFAEDALRLLRGIRFAAVYGLSFAPSAWRGLKAGREGMRLIAMERVGAELDKLLAGGGLARGAALLAASGLADRFKEPIPALARAAGACSAHGRGLAAPLQAASRLQRPDDGWAALHLLLGLTADQAMQGFADEAKMSFATLRFSLARQERLAAVLAFHAGVQRLGRDPQRDGLARLVLELGEEPVREGLAFLAAAERAGLAPQLFPAGAAPPAALLSGWLEQLPARTLKELAIDGRLLQRQLGRRPGPWLGPLLKRLLEAVMLGEAPNETEALAKLAVSWMEGE
ncbi:CCA tRNA nucleotidyltransferase [Paenibacillus pasadenensis]|uniref:CCA tRNA nucleotidyltransferase n=1 Tax=Paenibacillus TaxID=44249 RepID=UPI0003F73FEB|nr:MULTISPECIES: CCA tRNA nucleotidyltransferase [Paenibacillus]QGG56128.1 CCA tRNA nucleotidyltransferase [Paenibacillus sp. B01]